MRIAKCPLGLLIALLPALGTAQSHRGPFLFSCEDGTRFSLTFFNDTAKATIRVNGDAAETLQESAGGTASVYYNNRYTFYEWHGQTTLTDSTRQSKAGSLCHSDTSATRAGDSVKPLRRSGVATPNEQLTHGYFLAKGATIRTGMSVSDIKNAIRQIGAAPIVCQNAHVAGAQHCSSSLRIDQQQIAFKFDFANGKLASDSELLPLRLGRAAQRWMKGIYGAPTTFDSEELDPSGNSDGLVWSLKDGCDPGKLGYCAYISIAGDGDGHTEIKWAGYN